MVVNQVAGGAADEERQLVTRAGGGDMAAARALYDAHAEAIYRLAYRYAGEDAGAQDLVQDTFLRAFQRLADFRGEAPFGVWLRRIAVTVCLNGVRTARRNRGREVALDEAKALPSRRSEVDPHTRGRLEAAVAKLRDRERTVFLMVHLEGYSHAEIATVLGISQANSKMILFRVRKQLRAELRDLFEDSEP
ncbi:N/A [soil metagenome]